MVFPYLDMTIVTSCLMGPSLQAGDPSYGLLRFFIMTWGLRLILMRFLLRDSNLGFPLSKPLKSKPINY